MQADAGLFVIGSCGTGAIVMEFELKRDSFLLKNGYEKGGCFLSGF